MLPIGQVKHISICESWVQLARCSLLEYNEWALPCTGREYTQCHVWSKRTQWSEPHSSHPGKFWWCHYGWCRPGKGRWHSVGSTHSLGGHWIHTPPLGKAGANSQLPLAIRKADEQGQREEEGGSTLFTEYSIYLMDIYTQTFTAMNLAGNPQKPYQRDETYTADGL